MAGNPYILRRPCDNCPFRTDIRAFLRRERAREIVRSLDRGTFYCHKTVDYEDGDDDDACTRDSLVCAGSLIFQEKIGRVGQMIRIAERLRMYDMTKLDMDAPVFDSAKAFIAAQQGGLRARPRKGTR